MRTGAHLVSLLFSWLASIKMRDETDQKCCTPAENGVYTVSEINLGNLCLVINASALLVFTVCAC